jgi:putative inorganic carbon (HCO3(-)) transporter
VRADLALVGGPLGALGLAVLFLAQTRPLRLAGLAAWTLGAGLLALSLAPHGHHRLLVAAAVVGLAAAALLAWLFLRVPWLLAVAVLACAPARIPVSRLGEVGGAKANLLLPLYVVVAALVLVLAWQFLRGEERSRELGPFAWPLALFVAWDGLSLLWSDAGNGVGRHTGAVDLLFYVLPLALVALGLARLPWRMTWITTLYGQITAMGLAFALLGVYQYLTRTVYWNPKVKVDNAYAPVSWFYRVNSIFYDPSIYGRFLVVAIAASLVLVLFGRGALSWAAAAVAAVTMVGLVPSFSQSSFVALAAAIVAGLVVLWRRRALAPLAIAAAALFAVSLGVPQLRHRILGHAGLSQATGGRAPLVSHGIDLFVHHPLVGVGTGSFAAAYSAETGKSTKLAASHDAPITVAAETGLPGLALLCWLLALALSLPFRGTRGATATGRARIGFGLGLIAIIVHSLFYNALFEDPLFWALIALSALALREPEAART